MSKEHVSAVFADTYFTPRNKPEFLVALALAEWTNLESGICWPSVDSIAKRARTSVRGVQEALRQLSSDGKLSVEMGAHASGTSVYRLVYQPPPHSLHPPPQTSAANLHPEPEGTILPLQKPLPTKWPSRDEFVSTFLAEFVSYPDFPADDYLRVRWSDYDTTGWKKGNREIVNWRSLGDTLRRDYIQDRMQKRMNGNPNAPRTNGKHYSAPRERITETDEDRLIREARERGDI